MVFLPVVVQMKVVLPLLVVVVKVRCDIGDGSRHLQCGVGVEGQVVLVVVFCSCILLYTVYCSISGVLLNG